MAVKDQKNDAGETGNWEAKLKDRRASLVMEQQKAVEAFRAAQQRATEMQALIERINGAMAVIDELLMEGTEEATSEVKSSG